MKRLEGENPHFPNLNITLDEEQYLAIEMALKTKMMAKYQPFYLENNKISIPPMATPALIGVLEKTDLNELALHRLKKVCVEKTQKRIERCTNDSSIEAYKNFLFHLQKTKINDFESKPLNIDRETPTRVEPLI